MSLMGIDIGTTGTKAIAFSEDGKILASAHLEYNLLFPRSGWAEFDTRDMWKKIFSVIKEVNNYEKVKKDPVEAIAASTIGESFTPIDKNGEILYNTIYSTDNRSVKELEYILSIISAKDLYYITGLPPQYVAALNKILWIKRHKADIFKKAKKILFTEELFHQKLGLQDLKINYSLSSTTLFFDIVRKEWSSKILNAFKLDPELFAKPVPSGIKVGEVHKDIAESLDFKRKVSVVSGGQDQQCAAFGVGAITEGIAADGMGTVECITPAFDHIILKDSMFENGFSTRSHVVSDRYVTFAYNLTAGGVLKWYRDKLAPDQKNIARSKNIDAYDYFFSDLDFNPSRIYTLPYFAASGTPYHDPLTKGSIIGIGLSTERKDIFKSLVEGLIFEIRYNLGLLSESGLKISELRAVGGGSKSDYWLSLKSSILGKPIKRMSINEAGCLATMMLAGSGVGKFTIKEAQDNFVKVRDEFHPDIRITKKYNEYYEKYKRIYPIISGLYL